MAPAQAACKACRQSKTKCDLMQKTPDKCSRCSRIGLCCIPCEPSRRGQSHPNRVISKLGKANRALLEVDPATLKKGGARSAPPQITSDPTVYTWAMASSTPISSAVSSSLATSYEVDPSTGLTWHSLPCAHQKPSIEDCMICKSVRNLAHSWATVAGRKNSHKLLARALKLAAQCDIPVASVLAAAPNSSVPLLEVSSRCPPPVHQLISSGGLCWARGIINDTEMGVVGGFITNSSFNEVVCDASDLAVAWRESGGKDSLVEHFLHEDDAAIFTDLFESLSSRIGQQNKEAIQGEGSADVRVLDQRTSLHVPCKAHVVLYIDEGAYWMGAQFVPVDVSTADVALQVQAVPVLDAAAAEGATGPTAISQMQPTVEAPAAVPAAAPPPSLIPGLSSMDLTTEELVSMIADVETSAGRSSRNSRGSKPDNVMWSYDELTKELARSSANSQAALMHVQPPPEAMHQ